MSILSSANFTSLPLELIEQITSYLSTNDLLACSSVSSGWREALNNDVLWVKRCKGGYAWKSYAEELENQKSQIQPFFELPQCSEDTLEPLCKWRVHFMAQIHYYKNLKENKRKEYSVQGCFSNSTKIYYEANNRVIIPSESNSYEIWNTDGIPFCEDVISCGICKNADQFVYAFENYVVILQCNLLQVYENCDHKFKLLHRKLYDQPEKYSSDIPFDINISDWYWNFCGKNKNYSPFNKMIGFKDIFIGFNCESDLKNRIFHIWNFKKGIKIKEQKFMDFPNIVRDVNFNKTNDLVYVLFEIETQDSSCVRETTILGYNAITQNYTDLCIKINCSHSQRYFFFEGNYIVTLHSNIINVWFSSKNTLIKKKPYRDLSSIPFPFAFVIQNNFLFYAGNGSCSNRLTILDLDSLKVVKNVEMYYPIYKLMCTNPNLLLMKGNTRGTDEYEVSVWNVKDILACNEYVIFVNNYAVHSFKVREQFSGSLKLSKLISVQPRVFTVTHFW